MTRNGVSGRNESPRIPHGNRRAEAIAALGPAERMRIVRETFRMVEGLEAVRSDLAWRKWVCDDIVADLAARAPLSRAEIDLGGRLGDLIAMLDDLAELLESSGQMPAIEETALEEIERRLPRPPKRTVRRRRTRRDAPRAPASAQRVPAHG